MRLHGWRLVLYGIFTFVAVCCSEFFCFPIICFQSYHQHNGMDDPGHLSIRIHRPWSVCWIRTFFACSEAPSWGFMGMFRNAIRLLCDLQGPRTVSCHLSLSVAPWLVLATICVSHALQLVVIGAVIMPVALLIIGGTAWFVSFSCMRFMVIFFLSYLLYGTGDHDW